jgi:hypothetical protein
MARKKRYLGLSLSGAKSSKTTLAVLEYYPKDKKIFLLDIVTKIGPEGDLTGDEKLLEVLKTYRTSGAVLAVNAPLQLPPCSTCVRKSCRSLSKCSITSVRWAHEALEKMSRSSSVKKEDLPEIREFTPYTQRPVEVYLRYFVIPKLPKRLQFEIDETLGGSKAPLTARMAYLQRYIKGFQLIEVAPKLTSTLLGMELGASLRWLESHRQLETGGFSRAKILELLAEKMEIFVYSNDNREITENLNSFDSVFSALTGFLEDQGKCAKPPKGFPIASGWVTHPK